MQRCDEMRVVLQVTVELTLCCLLLLLLLQARLATATALPKRPSTDTRMLPVRTMGQCTRHRMKKAHFV